MRQRENNIITIDAINILKPVENKHPKTARIKSHTTASIGKVIT